MGGIDCTLVKRTPRQESDEILGRSKPELPLKNMNVTFNISSDTIEMMQTRLTRVPQPGGFATVWINRQAGIDNAHSCKSFL